MSIACLIRLEGPIAQPTFQPVQFSNFPALNRVTVFSQLDSLKLANEMWVWLSNGKWKYTSSDRTYTCGCLSKISENWQISSRVNILPDGLWGFTKTTSFVRSVIFSSNFLKSTCHYPSYTSIGHVTILAPESSIFVTYCVKKGSRINTSSPGPTKFMITQKIPSIAPLVTKISLYGHSFRLNIGENLWAIFSLSFGWPENIV